MRRYGREGGREGGRESRRAVGDVLGARSKGTFSSGMSDDPLIAVLAEAARLGEAALEAGDQADFGTLIDLAVQAGPSVTSVHSEDTSDVIPSAAEISCATSIADEL